MINRLTAGVFFSSLLLFIPDSSPAHAADPAMSLTECISLALKENRTIKNAYLNRVVQKYTLRMAEDTFVPTLVLKPAVTARGNTSNLGSPQNGIDTKPTTTTTTSLTATENLPTGGTLTATGNFNTAERNVTTKDWNINFTQPLTLVTGTACRSRRLSHYLEERSTGRHHEQVYDQDNRQSHRGANHASKKLGGGQLSALCLYSSRF